LGVIGRQGHLHYHATVEISHQAEPSRVYDVDHIMVCLPWLNRDGVLLITDALEDPGFVHGHEWGFALTEESPHSQDDWLA
jgi:hypothetical protein